MTAEGDFSGIVDRVLIEIEDIKGQSLWAIAEKEKDSATGAADFEFRPLTEEEKKELVNSLDAKGKQLLAELALRSTGRNAAS